MKRVAILGCCGAGKSTFARRLGGATGLPIIHLDREFWKPGWVASDREEFRSRVNRLYEADEWVADGNYASTMPDRLERADTVFVLDYPTRTCLLGLLSRVAKGAGRDRPDCAENCPERMDFELIRYILGYRKESRIKLFGHLDQHPHLTVHRFTNRKQLENYLDALPGSIG